MVTLHCCFRHTNLQRTTALAQPVLLDTATKQPPTTVVVSRAGPIPPGSREAPLVTMVEGLLGPLGDLR